MSKDRAKFPGRYFGGIAKPISLTCFLRDSLAHSCPSKSVGLPVAMGVSTFSLVEEGETSRLTTNSISIRLLEAVLEFNHNHPAHMLCQGISNHSVIALIHLLHMVVVGIKLFQFNRTE